jgi:hypothetical protein
MEASQQANAADAILTVVEDGALAEAAAQVAELLVPYVLRRVQSGGASSRPWLELLLGLVAHALVPQRAMAGTVLELALAKSDPSESADSRMASALLFGALAAASDNPSFVASTFLERATLLCQDTEGAVRAAMAAQLPAIARAVGAAVAKVRLLCELNELMGDEQSLVRAAAFEAAVATYSFWEREPARRRANVLPPIVALVESSLALGADGACALLDEEDRSLIRRVGGGLGALLRALAADAEPPVAEGEGAAGSDRATSIAGRAGSAGAAPLLTGEAGAEARGANFDFGRDALLALARSGDAHVRASAARGLAQMAEALGVERFVACTPLAAVFAKLAADVDAGVREATAARAHDLCALLGRERAKAHVAGAYRALLRTATGAIVDALLPHVGAVVSTLLSDQDAETVERAQTADSAALQLGQGGQAGLLAPPALASRASSSTKLGGGGGSQSKATSPASTLHCADAERFAFAGGLLAELVALEVRVKHNWRHLLLLLEQWRALPRWFDADSIHAHFVPHLFEYLQSAVPCCQQAAAKVVVRLMRSVRARAGGRERASEEEISPPSLAAMPAAAASAVAAAARECCCRCRCWLSRAHVRRARIRTPAQPLPHSACRPIPDSTLTSPIVSRCRVYACARVRACRARAFACMRARVCVCARACACAGQALRAALRVRAAVAARARARRGVQAALALCGGGLPSGDGGFLGALFPGIGGGAPRTYYSSASCVCVCVVRVCARACVRVRVGACKGPNLARRWLLRRAR